MSDNPDENPPTPQSTGRVTASQAMDLAVKAQEDAGMAQEAASNAIGITGELDKKIGQLSNDHIALAKIVNGLNTRNDSLQPSRLDGFLARLEKLEQDTKGAHFDWSAPIGQLGARLDSTQKTLAEQGASITELFDKVGVEPGGVFEDLAKDLEELKTRVDSTANLGPALGVLASVVDKKADNDSVHRLSETVAALKSAVENLERFATATTPLEARRSGNSASAKVLQLMRMIPAIGKDKDYRDRSGTSFKFRGVDQAMDAAGHAMREVGLTLRTEVLDRESKRDTVIKRNNEGAEYNQLWTTTVLTMRYVFVDPETGDQHVFEMIGEGRDLADKSSSKAAAMACKYGLFQALMIPVEGLNDTDADSERPAFDDQPSYRQETPGARVNRGEISPAQAVQEYQQQGANQPGASQEEKARGLARYIREAQAQEPTRALAALQKTKDRIAGLGLTAYVVDGVQLGAVLNAALQSVNAAIQNRGGAATQGVSRAEQATGGGGRAANPTPGPEHPISAQNQATTTGTSGSRTGTTSAPTRNEYNDALVLLDTPDVPQELVNEAVRVVNQYLAAHPEERAAQQSSDADTPPWES